LGSDASLASGTRRGGAAARPGATRFFLGSQRYSRLHATPSRQSAPALHAPTTRFIEQRKQVQLRQNDVGTQLASAPHERSAQLGCARQNVSSRDRDVHSDPGAHGSFGGGSQ
jgi:hypothetical protein